MAAALTNVTGWVEQWRWLGDIHAVAPEPWAGLIIILAAVACGIAVGTERERREKPAGVRTMALICVGSVIFTYASLMVAGTRGNPGRIAAQIATGVGFLGAGAIIRERGQVLGVTTGAAIWAIAAVGMIIGSGHVAGGIGFTAVILLALTGIRGLEQAIQGPCRFSEMSVEARYDGGKTRARLEAMVEDLGGCITDVNEDPKTDTTALTIRYCRYHRHHRVVRDRVAGVTAVHTLKDRDTGITPRPLKDH